MEYGEPISQENSMRHTGWNSNECLDKYYSTRTLEYIQVQVSEKLKGVDRRNRKIVVPKKTISHVMSSIHRNYKHRVGDIYSRHIISNDPIDMIKEMINRVIDFIVNDVKTHEGQMQNSMKLNKWTTILGDFNENGLRSHPPIKLRRNGPRKMMFFENY